MLDIQVQLAPAASVWRLRGDLTSAGASVLRHAADRLQTGKRVLVDLADVTRVDRPGLGALIHLLVRARRLGTVEVQGMPSDVARLLRHEGIDRLVPLRQGLR